MRASDQPSAESPFETLDLYCDASLLDPYPIYDALREAGEAVWLEQHHVWAIAGFDTARMVLRNHTDFISGEGIGLTPAANEALRGAVLASDAQQHALLRSVLNERLTPRGLTSLVPTIAQVAEDIVSGVLERGSFDAVQDLAQVFPVTVVADLIGVPDEVRPRLLRWADSMFNAFGPPNQRTLDALPSLGEMGSYLQSVTIDQLKPGSLGAAIYEAGSRGTLQPRQCAVLLGAYLGAGIDTTVNSIAAALKLFADYPDQWDLIRSNPDLIPQAFDEVLRLECPVLGFTRVAARDTEIHGLAVLKGQRVLVLNAAANRDGRKFPEPARFDVRRAPRDHLAFGAGRHHCAGQFLARIEFQAIFRVLSARVARFEAGAPVMHLNNVIRGLAALPMRALA